MRRGLSSWPCVVAAVAIRSFILGASGDSANLRTVARSQESELQKATFQRLSACPSGATPCQVAGHGH
jgi:hypothetical protein